MAFDWSSLQDPEPWAMAGTGLGAVGAGVGVWDKIQQQIMANKIGKMASAGPDVSAFLNPDVAKMVARAGGADLNARGIVDGGAKQAGLFNNQMANWYFPALQAAIQAWQAGMGGMASASGARAAIPGASGEGLMAYPNYLQNQQLMAALNKIRLGGQDSGGLTDFAQGDAMKELSGLSGVGGQDTASRELATMFGPRN